MKRFIVFATALILLGTVAYAANLEDFNGNSLNKMWEYRDPLNNGDYTISGGKLTLDLKANADMYIPGTDGGVLFLIDPPAEDNFSIEMLENVAVDGFQPPATHFGIIFFNEDEWAYSAWGAYANTDTRLEDCLGGTYRWRADTQIGIDQGDVRIDEEVYLRVVKKGESLEFFAKGSAGEAWISAGTDTTLGPSYKKGDYKIGIFAKSWGGSIDSTFEADYFNVPELVLSVEPAGKLATTWGDIKR